MPDQCLQVEDGAQRLVDAAHRLGVNRPEAFRAVEPANAELLDVGGDRGAGEGVTDHDGHGGVGVAAGGVQHHGPTAEQDVVVAQGRRGRSL